MPFMVIHRTAGGNDGYDQVDAIDEAALLVERLRNSEGIDQVRIYRMEEISFEFRTYYKVELGLPEAQGPVMSPVLDPEPSADPDLISVDTDGDIDGVNGRRGLFGR